jgi:hypothetical protein
MQVASGSDFRAHFTASNGAGPRWLAVLIVLLTCAVRAAAEERGEAPGPEPAASAAAVWYRSGEGCPDGAAFIELLRQRSVPAQLAQVGDRIDFVVTLGGGPDGGRGRLERQAEQGTVALREVQGKTCEGVADALALSLALAWDPNTQPPVTEGTPSSPEPSAVDLPAAPTRVATIPPPAPGAPAARTPISEPSRNVRIGLDGSVWSLSEGTSFFGGSVFGELRGSRVGAGFRPLIRLSAELALSPELGNDVQGSIGAARVEGCPVSIGSRMLQLRPCTGFDLGMLRAAGGGRAGASSSGFWAAWSTHARLSWETGATWGLDVQAGVIVPLTHYELTVGEPAQSVAELRRWGIAAGIGAHWAPP